MDTIISWVKNLIFIILFTALLEMFLPENKMGKYVRIVMGFFIISILLSPILVIFQQDYTNIQDLIPENLLNDHWSEIEARGRELEESNQLILTDYYQDRIKERVREIVNLYFGSYQQDIELTFTDNYQVDSLKVFLTENVIRSVEIEPVKIRGEEKEEERISGEENLNKERLKYNLSQVFQIAEDKIEILFSTGGT